MRCPYCGEDCDVLVTSAGPIIAVLHPYPECTETRVARAVAWWDPGVAEALP